MNARDHAPLPIWPLPLLIALLLVVAVHVAYALSIHGEHVPSCIPYWEGCVSISRAARHGLGNSLFRLLVIPCAVLHAAVWILAMRWLRGGSTMLVLGVVSSIALAVYATFLGTEGEVYRWLRRYGVVVYFGFGYLAQLALMRRSRRDQALPIAVLAAMSWLCVAMLGLGIGSVLVSALVDDSGARDRWENRLEWWLGLLVVSWYCVLAKGWWREAVVVRLTTRSQPN